MKKVLIITTSLSSGGITSFLIPLTNYIYSLGYDVSLAYTCDNGNFIERINSGINKIIYTMPSNVECIKKSIINGHILDLIKIKNRNHNQISPIASLQRYANDCALVTKVDFTTYDIAISSAEFYCNALLVNKVSSKKKIGWVHPDLRTLKLDNKYTQNLISKLDNLITVSETSSDYLRNEFPKYKNRIKCIRNMLDIDRIKKLSLQNIDDFRLIENGINIVTVCRFDNSSKRLDRIISLANNMKKK